MKNKIIKVLGNLFLITSPFVLLATSLKSENEIKKEELKIEFFKETNNQYREGWEKRSLPIGNGALGATIFGHIKKERVQLNEKSFWTGGPSKSRPNYLGGNIINNGKNGETIKEINRLFKNGDIEAASKLAKSKLLGPYNKDASNGSGGFRSYGSIYLDFSNDKSHTHTQTEYKRSLDLNNATITVTYKIGQTTYIRTNFVSYPDNVIVTNIKTIGPDKLNFNVNLEPDNSHGSGDFPTQPITYQRTWTSIAEKNSIIIKGTLSDNDLKFYSKTKVISKDGNTENINKDNKGTIKISDSSEVTILTNIGTDYKNNYPIYRSGETEEQLEKRVNDYITQASSYDYEQLYQRHIDDYVPKFSTFNLNLNQSRPLNKDTETILSEYNRNILNDNQKRYLEVLLFQFGRYLTLASSRETPEFDPKRKMLPSNLQGIWAASNSSAWHADYHLNVNLQMNYWPTYSTNMTKSALPLIDYIESLREPGRVTSYVYNGIKSTKDKLENGFSAYNQNNPLVERSRMRI
ncbi:glycoside hydrolase family 95 protein [Mycoplasmopsis alligatoris]|uniref:Uncharacterized protein n=1 Tax=Mycoplasmopsis alligatoris A21JP2 TaxID=747682 RepID=D4XX42_9BACT|nr:glycoside hydrolase family 95 protein [Mycoplasmopsis alligatoris]EFF41086.1 conserved hypothetical protein [Mycoplasmopsis alligatoris A21JP2]